jgi:hypothetical protein
MPLESQHIEDQTRQIIYFSCGYLEELLKHIVRTWPWENANPNILPLGTLVNRIGKHLPQPLALELIWLISLSIISQNTILIWNMTMKLSQALF